MERLIFIETVVPRGSLTRKVGIRRVAKGQITTKKDHEADLSIVGPSYLTKYLTNARNVSVGAKSVGSEIPKFGIKQMRLTRNRVISVKL